MLRVSGLVLALACALCCVMVPPCGGSLAQVSLYRRNSSLDLVAARASRNVAVSLPSIDSVDMRLLRRRLDGPSRLSC